MPPKKGKEAVPEPEPEVQGPLDLTPLSEQLRSPDEAVLAEALNKVLTLPFDDECVPSSHSAASPHCSGCATPTCCREGQRAVRAALAGGS